MADAGLSSILQVVLQNIASLLLKEMNLQRDLRHGLKMLKTTVNMLQGAVNDVERRHSSAQDVAQLQDELKVILYEANDVLHSFTTEVKRRGNIRLQRVRNSLSFINPKRGIFRHELAQKIHQVNESLNNLIRLHCLNVQPSTPTRFATSTSELPASENFTALRGEFTIHGRGNDTEAIVGLLTSEESTMAKPSVLPILGLPGIGKSTLAQEIYNDERVFRHFDVHAWANVSIKFDIEKLSRSIIRSVDESAPASLETWDLNQLQSGLQKRLSGRRYLLVLDDMWSEKARNWENLKKCFAGTHGSWILVTTRNEIVAGIVGTTVPYRLKPLSHTDCWSILSEHAFRDDTTRSSDIAKLREIGFRIAAKCNGSPLAAKMLGNSLRISKSIEKWQSVLDCQGTGASHEIMQSYLVLPPVIRVCFRYCSIFPKRYIFEKDILILLWMAQGFIKGQGSSRVEAVGEEVFSCLVHSLFFQQCPTDPSKFVMHDMIHDLAKEVSGNECCTIEDERMTSENVRHAAMVCSHFNANLLSSSSQNSSTSASPLQQSGIHSAYRYENLYSLLLLGNCRLCTFHNQDRLYKTCELLRTLDLSSCDITILDDSVSNLKHLTFLNLSNTMIHSLPNSLNELYNLQTLLLRNCYKITNLPKCMGSLHDLRHFDLSLDTDFNDFSDLHPSTIRLKSMPEGLEKHSQLQTLPRFVVSNKNRFRGIKELKNLNELNGDLCISNLHMISSIEEAAEGNLCSKKCIKRLKLQWEDDNYCRQMTATHEAILSQLHPHQELRELRIEGYGGTMFSGWIQSLTNLMKLTLSNCQRCKLLPTLGKLQFLRDLCLRQMDSIEYLDCQFCGENMEGSFPSLKRLEFFRLTKWKEWRGNQNCVIPNLQELSIKECPCLRLLAHSLPSDTTLTIESCQGLQSVDILPIHSLNVRASGEWIWRLQYSFPFLEFLTLCELHETEQSPGFEHIISVQTLRYLEIKQCPNLQHLPLGFSGLSTLQELKLHQCTQLKSLPEDLHELHSLEVLTLSDCPSLLFLPRIPRGLQMLSIQNCPSLKKRCKKDGGADWQKIQWVRLIYLDEEPYLCTH